ncbi:MAG: carbohydrate kinase family protein [Thermoproteota archaeon]
MGVLDEVEGFLEEEPKELGVVVMPDFFLDRLISLESEIEDFSGKLKKVADQGGGCIDGVEQTMIRGGNAVNITSALSALEVRVTPIVCTSRLGSKMMRFYLNSEYVDFSHVKVQDEASMTTALEFVDKTGKVNVMVRDVGSLADFGPRHLTDEDFKVMEQADYVCVFDWTGTRRFGTELAETVFRRVKERGKGKTYYDSSDPSTNQEEIPELMQRVIKTDLVDTLGVNENEAIYYASQLSEDIWDARKTVELEELAKKSARVLASHLSARVDLHTTTFSATFTEKGETVVPGFEVSVVRATGAGDSWNAGNILGEASGLSDQGRLALANAVAAYYISNPEGEHPTRQQLAEFCKKAKQKKT